MKHFIIDISYKVPFESISGILSEHRNFLQIGYDKGLLLCSGPKEPKTGGMVVARANDVGELKEFFTHDPYALHNMVEYKFMEFHPVKFQNILENWIEGK